MGYLFYKLENKSDQIINIENELNNYSLYFTDVIKSPVGKFTTTNILQTIEESLNFLEISYPILKEWIHKYLDENRGKLWLYYGILKGNELINNMNSNEIMEEQEIEKWPFLFKRTNSEYNNFIIDLDEAKREELRQRKRELTNNPNYKPFHPDGCPSNCSCWMLDSMEQWLEEERIEKENSRNIFFNKSLQYEFYNCVLNNIEELKEEWINWEPIKSDIIEIKDIISNKNTKTNNVNGKTPINIVISWIDYDFYGSNIFNMFMWQNTFQNIWENVDNIKPFIINQRQKLKNILELIES
jgi:hypothetical protein